MIEHFKRKYLIATVAAAMAALGVGGAAMAQSNSSSALAQKADTPAGQISGTTGTTEAAGQESNAPENSAIDPDNIQDTSSKDTNEAAETAATSKAAGTTEAAGQESPETPGQESGSEVPNDDGPGGHADEPGNPNADHQFQGVE